MRDDHIIDLLDRTPFAALGDEERERVEAHARQCAPCLRAYEAARLSSSLLRSRMAETVEPSPFFATRVTAALRERRAAAEGDAFVRMWRAARALVAAMALLVLLLAGASYFVQGPDAAPGAR